MASMMRNGDTPNDLLGEIETFTKEVILKFVKLNRKHLVYFLNSSLILFIYSRLSLAENGGANTRSANEV